MRMISRVPLLNYEQLSPAARDIYQSILKTRGNLDGPFLAWLHSPGLAAPAQALGSFCRYNTALAENESELLILLVAAHFRCTGEWQIHVPIACRTGLGPAVISAILAGVPPEFASVRLSALHRFSEELLKDNQVTEASFNRAREIFGDRGCVEITGVIGYYSFVAMTLNAYQIRCAGEEDPFGNG